MYTFTFCKHSNPTITTNHTRGETIQQFFHPSVRFSKPTTSRSHLKPSVSQLATLLTACCDPGLYGRNVVKSVQGRHRCCNVASCCAKSYPHSLATDANVYASVSDV